MQRATILAVILIVLPNGATAAEPAVSAISREPLYAGLVKSAKALKARAVRPPANAPSLKACQPHLPSPIGFVRHMALGGFEGNRRPPQRRGLEPGAKESDRCGGASLPHATAPEGTSIWLFIKEGAL